MLKRAGLKASAREILFDGADVPLGTMPDFQRSLPLAKALDPNTILAYEMNGETLPVKHGFPLRVIAPGWAGDSWVKWLTSIRVLDQEHDGFWMKSAYRHPGRPVAPGVAVPLDTMQPVTNLRIKSVIASPVDGSSILANPHHSGGLGNRSITSVEVVSMADVWKRRLKRPSALRLAAGNSLDSAALVLYDSGSAAMRPAMPTSIRSGTVGLSVECGSARARECRRLSVTCRTHK
jgi:hypothetical protein